MTYPCWTSLHWLLIIKFPAKSHLKENHACLSSSESSNLCDAKQNMIARAWKLYFDINPSPFPVLKSTSSIIGFNTFKVVYFLLIAGILALLTAGVEVKGPGKGKSHRRGIFFVFSDLQQILMAAKHGFILPLLLFCPVSQPLKVFETTQKIPGIFQQLAFASL